MRLMLLLRLSFPGWRLIYPRYCHESRYLRVQMGLSNARRPV